MTDRTKCLLLVLLLWPTWAFAHGVEILLTVSIVLVSPILFLLVIHFIPLFPTERARLIVVYLVSIALTYFLTSLLSYWEHETLINWLLVLIPIGATRAAYQRLRAKRNRPE
jgi:hypothetical protein